MPGSKIFSTFSVCSLLLKKFPKISKMCCVDGEFSAKKYHGEEGFQNYNEEFSQQKPSNKEIGNEEFNDKENSE
jgi:hypothetical protein